jgi:hypothetical protein
MRVRITQTMAVALAAGALAAGAAGTAQAQSGTPASVDTRWRAWVGCWEPVTPDNVIATADAKAMRVCVVPAGGRSSVDVVNVVNGKVAERTRVDATGAQKPIGREGCTGVESATWSADSLRVFLKADLTCDGVQRTTSGILAFATTGEWLDVQGVTTGKNSGVHVTRYRPVSDLASIPAEVTSAIPSAQLALTTARGAATGPVEPSDVVDAVKHVQGPVVEAWLLERGQGFRLSASELVALADAGVPGSVTDLMVALSFPKTFAINHSGREAEMLRPDARQGDVAGRTIPVTAYGYSPFGWGPYSSYYSWYGYNAYSPYGYGYGNPYGGYGYGYGGPIIIVKNPDQGSSGVATHPRVVRGGGYTEGRTTTQPSTSSGSYSGSSGSGSGSSSSGASSSAGSSSSGSSGGERTAHPRVP